MKQETAKTSGISRHRSTRAFSRQQKEFLLEEKCKGEKKLVNSLVDYPKIKRNCTLFNTNFILLLSVLPFTRKKVGNQNSSILNKSTDNFSPKAQKDYQSRTGIHEQIPIWRVENDSRFNALTLAFTEKECKRLPKISKRKSQNFWIAMLWSITEDKLASALMVHIKPPETGWNRYWLTV